MKYTLTLIGNSATPLTDELIGAASGALPNSSAADWLAQAIACDVSFEADDSARVESALRIQLAGAKIDLVVQPTEGRRKKLLVADMDSTIIEQECIDELAGELNIKEQIAEITERAMRGEIDFEPALLERVGLLAGLPLSALENVYKTRITQTPGGRALTATMRAHGATCALVSGGFTYFTQRIADAVGFDLNRANTLIFVDEKLSGDVARPILGRQAKVDTLVELRTTLQLPREATLAIGDGANDLGRIAEAGLGVAYHATPVVAEAADARIDHGDLSTLLYMQGYRKNEIVNM
mgnify:CR=1 FL=1